MSAVNRLKILKLTSKLTKNKWRLVVWNESNTIAAGAVDVLINFDEYDVPAIEGKFRVLYSNNK